MARSRSCSAGAPAPRLLVTAVLLGGLAGLGGCAQVLGIPERHTCDLGTEYCDGVCVDLASDQENCGRCGYSCNGASCLDGQCVDPDCSKEFADCTTPGAATFECDGLDCVEFAAMTKPVCLRRCTSNDQCPHDMFCAPTGSGSYAQGFQQYSLVGGHCTLSFCGGGAGTWYQNGAPDGDCQVGGDAFLVAGAVPRVPGSCIMVSTTIGQCVAAGDVPRDGQCTLQPEGCVPRDGYDACQQGDICVGQTGDATGYCQELCDPRQTGQCPSNLRCVDVSGAGVAGVCQF
jgi:hypothetical protein